MEAMQPFVSVSTQKLLTPTYAFLCNITFRGGTLSDIRGGLGGSALKLPMWESEMVRRACSIDVQHVNMSPDLGTYLFKWFVDVLGTSLSCVWLPTAPIALYFVREN